MQRFSFGLVFAVSLIVPGLIAQAQPFSLDPVASYLWGPANAVVSTEHEIILAHNEGVRVYANDPGGGYPLLGELVTSSPVRGVALKDLVVFAATSSGAIDVIDLTDPSHLFLTNVVFLPDSPVAIKVSGKHLIAASTDVVYAFDISSPSAPTELASCQCVQTVTSIDVRDSLIVVGQGTGGMRALRLHADGTMEPGGTYSHPEDFLVAQRVVTDGRYAFIPAAAKGLQIVDCADPANPTLAGMTVTFGDVQDAAIAGNRLLIADGIYGLLSYRLANPANPSWQDESHQMGWMTRVWPGVNGQFFASQGTDLLHYAVNVIGQLSYIGRFSPPGHYSSSARQGRWNFVGDVFGRWHVRPDSVFGDTSIARLGGADAVQDLMSHGDRLFSAEGAQGTRIYNVTSSGTLQPITTITPERQSSKLAKAGNRLTVVESGYGFQLYDVSTIFAPENIGRLRRARTLTSVAMPNEGFVYLGELGGGLAVYDLKHPIKPERLGTLPATVTPNAMQIDGRIMYVADAVNGLLIFSLDNPAAPLLLSQTQVVGGTRSLLLSGRTLYVGAGDGLLLAFDILDSAHPQVITSTKLPSPIVRMTKFGEQLWPVTETAIHSVDVLPPLLPGDFNGDNLVDAQDLTLLINFLYITGDPPYRPNAADVNGDGRYNLVDPVWLIDYLYRDRLELLPGTVE